MRQIYIVLTKKCNLTCDYCIRDYTINRNNTISLKDAGFVFDQITKTYSNFPQIILSGGEPTLLKDFHDIFSLATSYFKDKVVINSNGTTDYFFSKNFQTKLQKENGFSVQISIDGSEYFHDAIRGKSAFKRSIDVIKYLASKNVKVVVSTTVSTLDFLEDFDKLNKQLINIPIAQWNIKRVSYSGRANSGYSYFKSEDWNKIVDYVNDRNSLGKILISKQFDFSILDSMTIDQLSSIKPIKNCGSGTEKIYIYPNLDVLACTCYEKLPSGNLNETNLSEILISERHSIITNDLVKSSTCDACRYKQLCNGGCLGSGFSINNKLGLADIKCPKIVSESI